MRELHTNVVDKYASQWEQLGLKLGLRGYDIANISRDHVLSISCCAAMLEKWLQVFQSPTWGKLDDVIKSLAIVSVSLGPKGTVAKHNYLENVLDIYIYVYKFNNEDW